MMRFITAALSLDTTVYFHGTQLLARLMPWLEVPQRLRIPSIVTYTIAILEPALVY